MFRRIQRTIAILRAPADAKDRLADGVSLVPNHHEIQAARQRDKGIKLEREFNPALTLIELCVVVLVSVYLLGPLLHNIFKANTEAPSSLLISVTTGALSLIWIHLMQSLHGRIAKIIRLDFLDPYVGRRLKRTIQILKAKA